MTGGNKRIYLLLVFIVNLLITFKYVYMEYMTPWKNNKLLTRFYF